MAMAKWRHRSQTEDWRRGGVFDNSCDQLPSKFFRLVILFFSFFCFFSPSVFVFHLFFCFCISFFCLSNTIFFLHKMLICFPSALHSVVEAPEHRRSRTKIMYISILVDLAVHTILANSLGNTFHRDPSKVSWTNQLLPISKCLNLDSTPLPNWTVPRVPKFPTSIRIY